MINRNKITIKTAAGDCEAFEVFPTDRKNLIPILMYMDAIGVREATLVLAEKMAAEGFFVLLPNLFYRDHGLPLTDYPGTFTKEELGQLFPQLKTYMNHLTPDLLLEDARFYLDHLKRHPFVEGSTSVRIIGFCFGGGHGIRTAAKFGTEISHVACLHGGQLANEDAHSPIKHLSQVKAKLFFGHADHDSSMPRPLIAKLEQELNRHKHLIFTSKIFTDAHHGYTMMDLPAYVREASTQAMEQTIGFFKTN